MNDVGRHAAPGCEASAVPRPAIIGDQAAAARAEGVVLAIAPDDGGGVVDLDLAIEREHGRADRQDAYNQQPSKISRSESVKNFTANFTAN